MQPIHQTDNITVAFDQEKKMCEIILTHDFNDAEVFKNDLKHFLSIVEKQKPEKNLWNLENFNVTIGPELQEWIDININKPEADMGVKKEAFIIKDDIASELSVEQTMDETYAQMIETRLFNTRPEALDWLAE